MKKVLFPLLALSCLFAISAEALVPGDPAPPLASGEYVQGDPVKEFEKGKVYIVEFWATWCGPCKATIPHLNELHQKFAEKGVVVIGQNVWEREDGKIKPFVEAMGEKMTYRVAMDDKSDGSRGKMAVTWMQAAGQSGIPAAFVVDKNGVIAWIGHPAGLNEDLLNQIIEGSFDVAAQAEKMKKQNEAQDCVSQLSEQFKKALQEDNLEAAAKVVDELEALNDPRQQPSILLRRLEIAARSGDGKTAGEKALALLSLTGQMSNKRQAVFLLNMFAGRLCMAKGLEGLDPKIAVQLAEKASTLTGGDNAAVLNTLARAKFIAGDRDGAIASQEAAVKYALNEDMKAKLEKTLSSYREGEPVPADGD